MEYLFRPSPDQALMKVDPHVEEYQIEIRIFSVITEGLLEFSWNFLPLGDDISMSKSNLASVNLVAGEERSTTITLPPSDGGLLLLRFPEDAWEEVIRVRVCL